MSIPSPMSSDGGVSRFMPAAPLGHARLAADFGVLDLLLVDPAVLKDLEDQLDGRAVAQRFVSDYTDMWEQRFRRLAASVATQDWPAAMDAVISLKIASAMVGGQRLAWLAESLEKLIRREDYTAANPLLADIAEHGGQTIRELRFMYLEVAE
ncbi:Hpt domain-containing protein [Arthrobacter sp. R1-13]